MTFASDPATVLPSLALLSHRVRVLPMDAASLVKMPENTVLFLDARDDLAWRNAVPPDPRLRTFHANRAYPHRGRVHRGQFAVGHRRRGSGIRLSGRGRGAPSPGVGTRQLADQRSVRFPRIGRAERRRHDPLRRLGGGHQRLHGKSARASDRLGIQEFELLKYLVQHPGRVFTRAQLLQEVWGYDYYGGTRTVDVHIRRLRAKLGGEYEHVIGTVRNVGYRFDPPEEEESEAAAKDAAARNASEED